MVYGHGAKVWCLAAIFSIFSIFFVAAWAGDLDEAARNRLFCSAMGGETEVRHDFRLANDVPAWIRVDCETAQHVYEVGLDKRGALDSVQQAVFAATLTGKTPAVVLFDTDGVFGVYEYRILTVCTALGLECLRR